MEVVEVGFGWKTGMSSPGGDGFLLLPSGLQLERTTRTLSPPSRYSKMPCLHHTQSSQLVNPLVHGSANAAMHVQHA